MTQSETQIAQIIDAVYAVMAQTEDERVKNHLADALDGLVSALHGEYENAE